MRTALFCTVSLLALGAAAQAADNTAPEAGGRGQRQSAEERFKLADTNKDGKLSPDEYTASMTARSGNTSRSGKASGGSRKAEASDRVGSRFKELDTSNDGFLSLDEYKAGFANQRRTRNNGKS